MEQSKPSGIGDNVLYFEPMASDFRIGYECEWNNKNEDDDWRPTVMDAEEVYHAIRNTQQGHEDWKYRTPFITTDQVMKEGWHQRTAPILSEENTIWGTVIPFTKGQYVLRIVHARHLVRCQFKSRYAIRINLNNSNIAPDVLFFGCCDDINTFRTIEKLVCTHS